MFEPRVAPTICDRIHSKKIRLEFRHGRLHNRKSFLTFPKGRHSHLNVAGRVKKEEGTVGAVFRTTIASPGDNAVGARLREEDEASEDYNNDA